MNMIEYMPPTRANKRMHQRILRDMGRDVMPPSPLALFLGEAAVVLIAAGIALAVGIAVLDWWLMLP